MSEPKRAKARARPNLILMILAMVAVVGLQMAFGDKDTLPIATAVTGSLGTLGLALIKPEEAPEEKDDPDVIMPASTVKDVVGASGAAYERGYETGFNAGLKAQDVKRE